MESLLALWREIEHNASLQSAPCLLYKDMGLLGRVLRDEAQGNVDEIIVDGEEEFLTRFSSTSASASTV